MAPNCLRLPLRALLRSRRRPKMASARVPSSDSSLVRLRNLGSFERFRQQIQDLGYHYNVSIAAEYLTPRPITQVTLEAALEEAIQYHPNLAVTVEATDGNRPYFARLPSIELHRLITWLDPPSSDSPSDIADALDGILSKQNSTGWSYTSGIPLWRLVVRPLPQRGEQHVTEITWIWHHVIADGLSGLRVHEAISRALSKDPFSPPYDEGPITVIPRDEPLPLPMDDVMSLRTTLAGRLHHWVQNLFQNWYDNRTWTGPHYRETQPIETLNRHIAIPYDSVQAILKHCGDHGVTMTAILLPLIGRAITDCMPHVQYLKSAIAISVRPFIAPAMGITDDTLGLYISAFNWAYSRQDGSYAWEQAKDAKKTIDHQFKKADEDLWVASLKGVDDSRAELKGMMGTPRHNTFSLTNLGLFDGHAEEDDAVKIGKMTFSQSGHVHGSAMQFCVVSAKGGEMVIVVNWQKEILKAGLVEEINANLRASLMSIGETGSA